jgi:hypothetical protein
MEGISFYFRRNSTVLIFAELFALWYLIFLSISYGISKYSISFFYLLLPSSPFLILALLIYVVMILRHITRPKHVLEMLTFSFNMTIFFVLIVVSILTYQRSIWHKTIFVIEAAAIITNIVVLISFKLLLSEQFSDPFMKRFLLFVVLGYFTPFYVGIRAIFPTSPIAPLGVTPFCYLTWITIVYYRKMKGVVQTRTPVIVDSKLK